MPLSGLGIPLAGLVGYRIYLYQVLLTCAEQDPRHLQYVADVNESNVYVVTQGRKLYGMPTDFGFCIKVKTRAWPGREWQLLSPQDPVRGF